MNKSDFTTTTNYGLTISAEDKFNYYKAMDNNRLQELYNKLPKIDCKGNCVRQCSVVPLGMEEEDYITEGYGHDRIPEPEFQDGEPVCNQLTDDGRCSIHDRRPLICRLYGLVDNPMMKCDHGCEPEYWLSDEKARRLIDMIIKDGDIHESFEPTDSKFRKALNESKKG